jgi:hypothetical protein
MLVSIADQHGSDYLIPLGGVEIYADQNPPSESAMNARSLPRPTLLRHPFALQLAASLADAAVRAAQALRQAAQRRAAARRLERDFDAMAELAPRTLRDMNAPDWVLMTAQARREALTMERLIERQRW